MRSRMKSLSTFFTRRFGGSGGKMIPWYTRRKRSWSHSKSEKRRMTVTSERGKNLRRRYDGQTENGSGEKQSILTRAVSW